jgi:hypothetical protein
MKTSSAFKETAIRGKAEPRLSFSQIVPIIVLVLDPRY